LPASVAITPFLAEPDELLLLLLLVVDVVVAPPGDDAQPIRVVARSAAGKKKGTGERFKVTSKERAMRKRPTR